MPPPGTRYTPGNSARWEIRATSGRYASYWNAFLSFSKFPVFFLSGKMNTVSPFLRYLLSNSSVGCFSKMTFETDCEEKNYSFAGNKIHKLFHTRSGLNSTFIPWDTKLALTPSIFILETSVRYHSTQN